MKLINLQKLEDEVLYNSHMTDFMSYNKCTGKSVLFHQGTISHWYTHARDRGIA